MYIEFDNCFKCSALNNTVSYKNSALKRLLIRSFLSGWSKTSDSLWPSKRGNFFLGQREPVPSNVLSLGVFPLPITDDTFVARSK